MDTTKVENLQIGLSRLKSMLKALRENTPDDGKGRDGRAGLIADASALASELYEQAALLASPEKRTAKAGK